MEKTVGRLGFKGKSGWKRNVLDENGRHSNPPSEPRKWRVDGNDVLPMERASSSTVRIHKRVRKALLDQLAHENRKLKNGESGKLKEVDAVNEAIYAWILQRRVEALCSAEEVIIVFESSFDRDVGIALLGQYKKYISKQSFKEKNRKFPKFALYLTLHRQLRTSRAFKRDLNIVASYIYDFQVVR